MLESHRRAHSRHHGCRKLNSGATTMFAKVTGIRCRFPATAVGGRKSAGTSTSAQTCLRRRWTEREVKFRTGRTAALADGRALAASASSWLQLWCRRRRANLMADFDGRQTYISVCRPSNTLVRPHKFGHTPSPDFWRNRDKLGAGYLDGTVKADLPSSVRAQATGTSCATQNSP